METKYNSLYEYFLDIANKNKNRVVVIENSKKITFKELLNSSDSIATYLDSHRIKKGDRVGIFLPNCWEYIAIIFAILKVGAVVVPINYMLKSKELSYILEDSKIEFIFTHENLINIIKGSVAAIGCGKIVWLGDKIQQGVKFSNILKLKGLKNYKKRNLDDLAMIFYTSGTDGCSKGVMASNKNILSSISKVNNFFELKKRDRVFLIIPMFHNYTLITGVLTPILNSVSIYIYQKEYTLIKAMIKSKATIFLGIPDIYHSLYKIKLSLNFKFFNKIHTFVSGTSPLNVDILKNIEKKFKSFLIEGYGLTEAVGAVTANSINNRKLGSVGKALDGIEVKIINKENKECKVGEVGEIIIKSDTIMLGYINDDKLTKDRLKDNWLYTNDLGYLDKDGFLFLKGRKSELIKYKGLNIYPIEIEVVIDRFEGIKKSAVIAYKNNQDIEEIIAFIELENGEISIEKLDNYVRGFLSNYKIPQKYIVIEKLPRNSTGKILKKELREYFKNYKKGKI